MQMMSVLEREIRSFHQILKPVNEAVKNRDHYLDSFLLVSEQQERAPLSHFVSILNNLKMFWIEIQESSEVAVNSTSIL